VLQGGETVQGTIEEEVDLAGVDNVGIRAKVFDGFGNIARQGNPTVQKGGVTQRRFWEQARTSAMVIPS
jgi:hypothetical protein